MYNSNFLFCRFFSLEISKPDDKLLLNFSVEQKNTNRFSYFQDILCSVLLPKETAANERHFPRNILQGSWEAMWWAFASMTTLG